MKIYLAHSYNMNYMDEFYNPIRNSDLNNQYDFIYFCDKNEYTDTNSKKHILSSDLVIVDLTLPSTGTGIEIGWADANNIPFIIVHQKDTKISKYMYQIAKEVINYKDSNDMINKLIMVLTDFKII